MSAKAPIKDEPEHLAKAPVRKSRTRIRLENLVAVTALPARPGDEKTMLGFETLTRAPFDVTCLDLSLMTPAEIAWLDAYHADVRATLLPLVDGETATWLDQATRPLG